MEQERYEAESHESDNNTISVDEIGEQKEPQEKRDWWKYRLFETNDFGSEQIEYSRELFDYLSKRETRLKAMTIIGSTIKGYASLASDIDVSFFVNEEKEGTGALDHCEKLVAEFGKEKGLVLMDVVSTSNVDIKKLSTIDRNPKLASTLIFPGFGKIESLRDIGRKTVAHLDSSQRDSWIEKVVKELCDKDRYFKMVRRGKLDQLNTSQFEESRRQLFRNRVKRVFFPNENL